MNLKKSLFLAFLIISNINIGIANNTNKEECNVLPVEAENQMLFMLGTWRTEGTQYWYDGTWVKHKGIVKCKLLDDGVTIERTFWASFDNGASLGGRALTIFNPNENTWSGKWIPTTGNWDAGPSIGRMEGDEYVDIGRGTDQKGRFMSKTRIFDITEGSYSVSTDIFYDSGEVSKNNWNIQFSKIEENDAISNEAIAVKDVDFLVGNWIAEGQLQLSDGSYATHVSFVEAQENPEGNIERQFWGSISVGVALRGVSVHKKSSKKKQHWDVQWIPKAGAPAPVADGYFDGNKFVEAYEQQGPNGSVTVRTTYYDITPKGYKVSTDVLDKEGNINEGVWYVSFKRL